MKVTETTRNSLERSIMTAIENINKADDPDQCARDIAALIGLIMRNTFEAASLHRKLMNSQGDVRPDYVEVVQENNELKLEVGTLRTNIACIRNTMKDVECTLKNSREF